MGRRFRNSMQRTGLEERIKLDQLIIIKLPLNHRRVSVLNNNTYSYLPIPMTERICDAKSRLASDPPISCTRPFRPYRISQDLTDSIMECSPSRDTAISASTIDDSSSVSSESRERALSTSSSLNNNFLKNLLT